MRASQLFLSLALSAAITPALAETFRFSPCNGTYSAHSAGATATAGTMTMPVGNSVIGQARITMGQCGREMVLDLAGQTVVMAQSIMNEREYSGSVNMGDGVSRVLTLTLDEDRNLRGALVAKDANIRANRPIWLMLSAPEETRFEGCGETQESDRLPSPPTDEANALSALLAEAGVSPADGFTYADYMTTQKASSETRVQMRLSAEGNVLPHLDLAFGQLDPDSAYCLGQEFIEPTRQILEFDVKWIDNDPFVFARVIDVETSKIVAQQEGVPASQGDEALSTAMQDAWTKLAPKIGPMTTGITSSR